MIQQTFVQVLLVRVLAELDAKILEARQLSLEPPNTFHEGDNYKVKAKASEESELSQNHEQLRSEC